MPQQINNIKNTYNYYTFAKHTACTITASLLLAHGTFAQESEWSFDLSGFVDARVYASDDEVSTFQQGFGKVRYGGSSNGARERFRINEVSLIGRVQYGTELSLYVNAQHNPDLDSEIDIVESYLEYRPVSLSRLRFGVKAGAFFPNLSFENDGAAWSNSYTLTNSAANTWFAEEVRPIGAEVALEYRGDTVKTRLTGSLFYGNDRSGTALSLRGFVLNDQKVGIFGEIPIAIIPAERLDINEPFVETDGRPGFALSFEAEYPGVAEINIYASDNRGDTNEGFNSLTRVWDTEFLNVATKTNLPGDVTFIAQGLWGESFKTPTGDPTLTLGTTFQTLSGLVSRDFGPVRFSFRAEHFDQNDISTLPTAPDLDEDGFALTTALQYTVGKRHRLTAEYLYVDSDRDAGSDELPLSQSENLFQLNYRVSF